MIENNTMQTNSEQRIKLSAKAHHHLSAKGKFFASRQRYARIVLNGVSCSGAKFNIFYDHAKADDLTIRVDDISFLVEAALLERFGGFELDVMRFFFSTRILIQPFIDDRNCDCKQKCNNHKEEK